MMLGYGQVEGYEKVILDNSILKDKELVSFEAIHDVDGFLVTCGLYCYEHEDGYRSYGLGFLEFFGEDMVVVEDDLLDVFVHSDADKRREKVMKLIKKHERYYS